MNPVDLSAVRARFAPGWGAEVGVRVGWHGVVAELDRQLTEVCPDIKYIQIKIKFGELRVYTTADGDDAVDRLIRDAEERAARTCEGCGAGDARMCKRRGRYQIMCAECAVAEGWEDTTPETVDALESGMSGRWLVTSQGSQHIWDLDEMTYTRLPAPGGRSRLRRCAGPDHPGIAVAARRGCVGRVLRRSE